jgi:hypothetical protein
MPCKAVLWYKPSRTHEPLVQGSVETTLVFSFEREHSELNTTVAWDLPEKGDQAGCEPTRSKKANIVKGV